MFEIIGAVRFPQVRTKVLKKKKKPVLNYNAVYLQ